jgi:LacI family transcriptional regulator
MSSLREIAKSAGVSTTTVSRALNNDPAVNPRTRERVLAVANGAGYVATIGRRVTTQIGLVYTGDRTLSNIYDPALLGGIVRGLDESRFDVVILNLRRDKKSDETYTQFFMRKGVRGVILRTVAESRHVCEAIAEEGFPAVVISERFDSPDLSFIDCDSKSDSVRAVQYLISLGHRRIAFAMHVVPDCDHLDRFEGYKEALAENGLGLDESVVFKHPATLAGGATIMEMVTRMSPPPTAIYFADPLLAMGAVNRAHYLGVRIPRDISVVGFDDAETRYTVHPTLSAVCQDTARLGFEACVHLTRMLTGEPGQGLRKTLSCFFEVNESTGPPPETAAVVRPKDRRSETVPAASPGVAAAPGRADA